MKKDIVRNLEYLSNVMITLPCSTKNVIVYSPCLKCLHTLNMDDSGNKFVPSLINFYALVRYL